MQKEYLETRTQHAPQRHLSALKTDCNPTSMPRREYQSSCVCVPPGGPPEGILDVAEYIVCRVVFFLFVLVFYPSTIFFRRSCKFFGEKTIVAKKTEKKRIENISSDYQTHIPRKKERKKKCLLRRRRWKSSRKRSEEKAR